ncbi:hypothetical protein ACOSQ2_018284 [Xanthoceras sorbifolium]
MDHSQEGLNLNEWEHIQSPSLNTLLPTTPRREWDMVSIRESYLQDSLSLFPPSHHQDLQVSSHDEQPNSPSSPPSLSSSSSSSDVSSSDLRARVGRQLSLRFKILGSGIVRVAAKVRYCAVCVGGFWSFAAMTGLVATVLLSLLYARLRRWRARVLQEENNNRLIFLIKEKDQKINQLLLQVSQMNQLLSGRRKVPVIRIW